MIFWTSVIMLIRMIILLIMIIMFIEGPGSLHLRRRLSDCWSGKGGLPNIRAGNNDHQLMTLLIMIMIKMSLTIRLQWY